MLEILKHDKIWVKICIASPIPNSGGLVPVIYAHANGGVTVTRHRSYLNAFSCRSRWAALSGSKPIITLTNELTELEAQAS